MGPWPKAHLTRTRIRNILLNPIILTVPLSCSLSSCSTVEKEVEKMPKDFGKLDLIGVRQHPSHFSVEHFEFIQNAKNMEMIYGSHFS